MAVNRISGANGALYVDISTGANGSAVRVSTISSSKRSFNTNQIDVTAYEDANLVFVAGKPDASTSYSGFLDTNQDQLWYPSRDGVPRKFYDYVDLVNSPAKYFFGTATFDFAIEQEVSGAVTVATNMKPSGSISRNWA